MNRIKLTIIAVGCLSLWTAYAIAQDPKAYGPSATPSGTGPGMGFRNQNRHGQPYPNSDPFGATKRESEPNPAWSRLAKG